MKKAYQINNSLSEKPLAGFAPQPGDSATENIGGGYTANELSSDYDLSNNGESDKSITYKTNNDEHKSVFDLLVLLGDEMDSTENETLANFSDYLLKKFAEADDPVIKFNQLMLKINNADLVHTNDILKKLTKIYSRTILLEYRENKSIAKSKESAYKKVVHRAEQYIAEE